MKPILTPARAVLALIALLSVAAASLAFAQAKNFHALKPQGLFDNPRFAHVIEVDKGKLIYLSGQVPVDEKGQLVGKGDFKAQSIKTWENVMLALKAAGLDASDIIKLNAYVVDLPQNMAGYRDARLQFFPPGTPQPASTLIGVSSLALEGQMIEVEAIAVTR
ncbi:MAG: RidA family protein [Proteobacteria bacterium]|nr:RidA family protein [Pseudomonadota bacterium]